MKPAHFHILVALAECDRHGADIKREVLRLSEGQLTLWPTTLYKSLDDLLSQGLIEELEEIPRGTSERRRYYRATRKGLAAMGAETKRLSRLLEAARVSNPMGREEA